MKYLLITFLLFSFNAYACSNWITVSELAKSQAGEAAKAGCKKGEKCFCYEGIDLRDAKVGMKMVDDETKPIYQDVVETREVLIGFEQKQVDDETKPILDAEGNITGHEQKLVDDETKPIYEMQDFVIGKEVVGYEQKEVEGLIVDEAKKAARLEKEEQQRLERIAREERKQRREEAREAFIDSLTLDDQGNELPKDQVMKNINSLREASRGRP